ncbi:hypothetical protein HPB50_001904 [Hyalomma asiaticum]|uniref:Uncharacterized protein n=1 Tax=Hyalomma asiaticum TaxID=266040 RepID=A0ACB7TD72_HYAAI|nr:hypothetical protein HPB50_001904 [Hyalomma asiaticum]
MRASGPRRRVSSFRAFGRRELRCVCGGSSLGGPVHGTVNQPFRGRGSPSAGRCQPRNLARGPIGLLAARAFGESGRTPSIRSCSGLPSAARGKIRGRRKQAP